MLYEYESIQSTFNFDERDNKEPGFQISDSGLESGNCTLSHTKSTSAGGEPRNLAQTLPLSKQSFSKQEKFAICSSTGNVSIRS